MKVSVQSAEIKLSELVDAALAGEDVVISKDGRPAVRIVPIQSRRFKIGMMQGQFGEGPDFFEPMSEEELALWEGDA
ncbi:type II toxin-antitoxin system prevent-host-death family antitoxin [Devosia sp.]|uniref:type II toxin-antitoxin system Phd/YefM family antitoxin n=1 Tax=Devosia sp. TaxID=1871048 RepID=UPI002AFEAF35|nr:type II toxin-antitoxin system prevent-host-death family antitoxin [Devosia sp.]